MNCIWKFNLKVTDLQEITMPAGAQLLYVAGQEVTEYGERLSYQVMRPMLWAQVDSTARKVGRRIGVYGTGHPMTNSPGEYVGSVICDPFVWHVFDLGES